MSPPPLSQGTPDNSPSLLPFLPPCAWLSYHCPQPIWLSLDAPRDVRVEVTSPVCEGKEVTLKCHDSANPPSHTYAWILEGQILPHSSAQFRLWPVREVDGGSYRCQATNDIGTADSPPTFLEVYCE